MAAKYAIVVSSYSGSTLYVRLDLSIMRFFSLGVNDPEIKNKVDTVFDSSEASLFDSNSKEMAKALANKLSLVYKDYNFSFEVSKVK